MRKAAHFPAVEVGVEPALGHRGMSVLRQLLGDKSSGVQAERRLEQADPDLVSSLQRGFRI